MLKKYLTQKENRSTIKTTKEEKKKETNNQK